MSDRVSSATDQLQLFAMSFLLPGLVPLFALATLNPSVASWFGNASRAPTFAGAFFVVIGAVAVGFVINAFRFAVYERSYFGRCLVEPSPQYDLTKRKEFDDAYMDLRRSFYFHYQAYSNLSVAIPAATFIWIAGLQLHGNDAGALTLTWPAVTAIVAVAALISVLLGLAGCESIRRYNARRGDLLGYRTPAA